MKPIVVSDILAVGEVPSLEHVAILAKAGFKSILNNQPDDEVARLPSSSVLAGEAAKYGLSYAYAPVASRMPTPEELLAFARALERLPAPIYAFCYSGSRSAAATAFVLTKEKNPGQIIAEFETAGFGIEALRPWLNELRELYAPGAVAAEAAADALVVRASTPATPIAKAATIPTLPTNGIGAQTAVAPAVPVGIVVHARPRGASGFAMVNTYVR